jgi:hypothetical protein
VLDVFGQDTILIETVHDLLRVKQVHVLGMSLKSGPVTFHRLSNAWSSGCAHRRCQSSRRCRRRKIRAEFVSTRRAERNGDALRRSARADRDADGR